MLLLTNNPPEVELIEPIAIIFDKRVMDLVNSKFLRPDNYSGDGMYGYLISIVLDTESFSSGKIVPVTTWSNSGWNYTIMFNPKARKNHIQITALSVKGEFLPGGQDTVKFANAWDHISNRMTKDKVFYNRLKHRVYRENAKHWDYTLAEEFQTRGTKHQLELKGEIDLTELFEEVEKEFGGNYTKLNGKKQCELFYWTLLAFSQQVEVLGDLENLLYLSSKAQQKDTVWTYHTHEPGVVDTKKERLLDQGISRVYLFDSHLTNNKQSLNFYCPRNTKHFPYYGESSQPEKLKIMKDGKVFADDRMSVCENCQHLLKCASKDFKSPEYYASVDLPQSSGESP